MLGDPIDKIRVPVKGHNDPSNMIDLSGIGESLMPMAYFAVAPGISPTVVPPLSPFVH